MRTVASTRSRLARAPLDLGIAGLVLARFFELRVDIEPDEHSWNRSENNNADLDISTHTL